MLSQTRSALFTFSSFHFHYTTVKIKNNWRIFSGIFGSAALNYNSIYPSKNGFRMRAICYTLSRGTAAAILPLSMYWSWTMSIVDYPASVLSCTTIIRIKSNMFIHTYQKLLEYFRNLFAPLLYLLFGEYCNSRVAASKCSFLDNKYK